MLPETRLHHVAIVSNDLERAVASLEVLGFRRISEHVHDMNGRKCTSVLLSVEPAGGTGEPLGTVLEIIKPQEGFASLSTTVQKRNDCLHHMCIEVPNVGEAINAVTDIGAEVISDPVPAAMFSGRRMAVIRCASPYFVPCLCHTCKWSERVAYYTGAIHWRPVSPRVLRCARPGRVRQVLRCARLPPCDGPDG